MFINRYRTHSSDDLVMEMEIPGVDPKNVKVSYDDEGRLYYNNSYMGIVNGKYYDYTSCRAELKHGLLTVTVPYKKPVRTEVPLVTLG